MQQGGHQGLRIQLPIGALQGHGNGMGDVGLAAASGHAQMGFIGEFVGTAHLLNAFWPQVIEFAHQRSKAGRCCIGGGFFVDGGVVSVTHGLTVAFCQSHRAGAKKKHC